jgi:hypothetical protein
MHATLSELVAAVFAGHTIDTSAAFEHARRLRPVELGEMLHDLELVLRELPPDGTGPLALLAGAVVEIGGPPRQFPAIVFDRIAEWFGAVRAQPVDAREDFALPEAFWAYERAAMAALSRSAELRRTLPQRADILARTCRYQERYGFTGKMLSVLDDEPLIVLHPTTARGWHCRIAGIADNFQLHSLLLARLAGDGPERIASTQPSVTAIAAFTTGDPASRDGVHSDWQLANYTALRPGSVIDHASRNRTWIWNEGFPAEIAPFEGVRTVVIGPSSIQRNWPAGRLFAGMPGSLNVIGRVADAGALIDRILAANAAETP